MKEDIGGLYLNIDNLEATVQRLIAMLPKDFLSGLKDAPAKSNNLSQYQINRNATHPLLIFLKDLEVDVKRSIESGGLSLGESSMWAINFLGDLRFIASDKSFPKVLERLRGFDQFFSTAFEVYIFAYYYNNGRNIIPYENIYPTSENNPDYFCDLGEEGRIFIECKNMEDDFYKEERVWIELTRQLVQYFMNQKDSFIVRVGAKKVINFHDIDVIKKETIRLYKQFPEGGEYTLELCDVKLERIMRDGEIRKLPLTIVPADGEAWHCEMEASDEGEVRKICAIAAKKYEFRDKDKTVGNLIKNASKQLPPNHAGVIHLNIPYLKELNFMEVFSKSISFVEHFIKKYDHVCAVVITGKFYMPKKQPEAPINYFSYVIPNYNSKKKLPKNFRIMGSSPADILNVRTPRKETVKAFEKKGLPKPILQPVGLGREGAFYLDFEIKKNLADMNGDFLHRYCSHDGSRQLMIWQAYNNEMWIELRHEDFGRKALIADLSTLEAGGHKLAVSWDAENLYFSVDGKTIEGDLIKSKM